MSFAIGKQYEESNVECPELTMVSEDMEHEDDKVMCRQEWNEYVLWKLHID